MATRNSISRFDAASFRIDEVTGDLHVPVTPTKPGIYLYRNPKTGAIQRELRSRAEVLKADSLQTLEGKPFTNDHPKNADGKFFFLTKETAKQHQTGMFYGSHTVSPDGLHTSGMVVVSDPAHIDQIKAGKQAVSCGYKCDEDYTPGVDEEFGEYDMAQKNIQYNHLANVYRGRMGEGAKLRFDSEGERFDAEEIDPDENEIDEKADVQNKMGALAEKTNNKTKTKEKKKRMATLKLDHWEGDVDEAAELALKIEFANRDQKLGTEKQRADAAESLLVTEKARAERLDAELAISKQELTVYNQTKATEARKALEATASTVLTGQKFDGLSDREVKEMAIEKALPWAKDDKALGERTDEWIDTMYAVAVRPVAAPVAPTPAFQQVIKAAAGKGTGERVDADDPATARQEMLDYIANAHKAGVN